MADNFYMLETNSNFIIRRTDDDKTIAYCPKAVANKRAEEPEANAKLIVGALNAYGQD